jgi:Peptidase family M28
MLRRYLLLPLVIAATILIAFFVRTPPSSNGGTGFDVGRAKADVAEMARTPRPVGSAGNARTHDWLKQRFDALGLTVETQSGIGVRQSKFDTRRKGAISVSPFSNVIAVLPGRDRSKEAIALMAHYDSVPWSYGASDDAAGVATLLETARLLSAGQRPLRDVVFLATDAEEVGLIGAQEFFDAHPLAAKVGAVVNVEARGSRGRAIMFQTSDKNGALIDLWAKNAVHPTGNSMANAVYQRLPNDTDLSVSLAKGKIGINSAFIDGLADYHMPTDAAANLDQRALGDLGNFALTTTRALANAEMLPAKTADAAYFDVFGSFVFRYPLAWGWGFVALGALGLGFVGIGRIGVSWLQAAKATLGVLALTLGTGVAMHFVMQWLSGKGTIALLDRINEMDGALWIFIAIVASVVLLSRPRAAMWVGGVATTLLFALAAQIWLPGGSWIFIWAALLGNVMIFASGRLGLPSPWVVNGSALLGGLWGALLLEGLITTYMTVAPLSPAPMVLIIPLSIALLGPVLADSSAIGVGRKVGAFAMAFAVIGLIWVSTTNRFSTRHPKPADLFHVTDGSTGKSWWATTSGAKNLPAGASERLQLKGFEKLEWHGTLAPASAITAPDIRVSQNGGRMRLTATSMLPPRNFTLVLKSDRLLSNVTMHGKPIIIKTGQPIRLSWRAEMPNAQLVLEFDKGSGGSIDLDYLYALPGMPSNAPSTSGKPTDWALMNHSRVLRGSKHLAW